MASHETNTTPSEELVFWIRETFQKPEMVCDDARTKCTIEWSLNPDAYPKIFWVFFTFFFIMLCIVIVDDYNKDAKANESKQMLRRTESSVVLAESADGAELESASN